MSVYYFYGDDTWAARQAIGELAKKEEANIRWLDEASFEERPTGEVLGGRSLFGKEVVVLRDPSVMVRETQDKVVNCVQVVGEQTYVLWDRDEIKKSMPVWRRLRKQSREFASLDIQKLIVWLRGQAEDRGGVLDAGAAEVIVERIGTDRWQLLSNLERMLLRSKQIGKLLVEEEIAFQPEAEVFAMLDALTGGNKKEAVRSIEVLLDEGASEFYILSMLAYQFRTMLMIKSGIDGGKSQGDIVREGKMKPFVVQKNYSQAKRKSRQYWRESLTRILAMDFAIKQGKIDARTAVLMLVISLGD